MAKWQLSIFSAGPFPDHCSKMLKPIDFVIIPTAFFHPNVHPQMLFMYKPRFLSVGLIQVPERWLDTNTAHSDYIHLPPDYVLHQHVYIYIFISIVMNVYIYIKIIKRASCFNYVPFHMCFSKKSYPKMASSPPFCASALVWTIKYMIPSQLVTWRETGEVLQHSNPPRFTLEPSLSWSSPMIKGFMKSVVAAVFSGVYLAPYRDADWWS